MKFFQVGENGDKMELFQLLGMIGDSKFHHMFQITYSDVNYDLEYIKTVRE
jgi:hypothetical protein